MQVATPGPTANQAAPRVCTGARDPTVVVPTTFVYLVFTAWDVAATAGHDYWTDFETISSPPASILRDEALFTLRAATTGQPILVAWSAVGLAFTECSVPDRLLWETQYVYIE